MRFIKKTVVMLLVLTMIASMFIFQAGADSSIAYGAATVSASVLNIRSGPGTAHSRVSYVGDGSIVVILEKTTSEWYKINYHGTVGYVNATYLTDVLTAENFNATGTIKGTDVRMRKSPSTDSAVIAAYDNISMDVIGINNGWYKVKHDGNTGYIRSDLMEITDGPDAANVSVSSNSSMGATIANHALQYLGYNYVYGAESPSQGFDCSGLVYYVYGQHGYSVSRTASQQYKNNGYSVSKSELQAGDLVFFSSNGYSVTHVGIYIGDNQFVHASTSNTGVIISNLTSSYYTRVWFGAKRIV